MWTLPSTLQPRSTFHDNDLLGGKIGVANVCNYDYWQTTASPPTPPPSAPAASTRLGTSGHVHMGRAAWDAPQPADPIFSTSLGFRNPSVTTMIAGTATTRGNFDAADGWRTTVLLVTKRAFSLLSLTPLASELPASRRGLHSSRFSFQQCNQNVASRHAPSEWRAHAGPSLWPAPRADAAGERGRL